MTNLSILYHLIEDRCWHSVNTRVLKHPEECSTWVTKTCESGQALRLLPLHAAILLRAPEEIILQILDSYKEGAMCKDHKDHLPLHLALLNGSSVDVVSMLVLAYPDGVNVQDPNGNFPIDIARMSSTEHKEEYIIAIATHVNESYLTDPTSITGAVRFENPTDLTTLLIDKKWVEVLVCIDNHPDEIRKWVTGLRDACKIKLLPIHIAVSYGASENIIRKLLDAFPESVGLVDERGCLPLHRAVIAEADIGVIIELLVRYPSGLTAKDAGGKSPFENAASLSCTYRRVYKWAKEWCPEFQSKENVQQFLSDYDNVKHRLSSPPTFGKDQLPEISLVLGGSPKSVTDFKSSGDDSLYNMIKKAEWSKVKAHITENSESCRKWMMKLHGNAEVAWRLLPLHVAIIYGAPEQVVKELLMIYRDGAKVRDDAGLLPLHLALKLGSGVGVVALLILAFRDSVFVRDNKGKLPIDIARSSSFNHKYGYLFTLLWGWSRSSSIYLSPVVESTNLQVTKLFSLIYGRRWIEAISWMKETPNECKIPVTFRDECGDILSNQLPLHTALFVGAKEDFIRVLLRTHPEGARVSDGSGMLPLHIALEKNASVGIVMILAKAYPDGIFAKDDLGRLPIDIAESSSSSYKYVYIWLLQCLSIQSIASDETLNSNHLAFPSMPEQDGSTAKFERLCVTEAIKRMIFTKSVLKIGNEVLKIEDQSRSNLLSLLHQKRWSSAKTRALNNPKECSTWFFQCCDNVSLKFLPLHAAILLGAPEETIGQILMCYQEGAKLMDHSGHLPLHLALLNGSSLGVVCLLMLSYPDSVFSKDPNGNLPLDIARMSPVKHKQDYVYALSCPLRAPTPKDLIKKDSTTYENPSVLFQLLIEEKWSEAMARLATHPDEVTKWMFRVKCGREERLLPIHVAVSLGAPEELIRGLIVKYPKSIGIVDDKGCLPLHRAMMAESDIGIVVELVMRFPTGLHVKDNKGRTPSDRASTVSGIYRRVYQWACEWSTQYECDETRMELNEQYDEVKYDVSFDPTLDGDLPEVSLVLSDSRKKLFTLNLSSGDNSFYEMIKKAEWENVLAHLERFPDSCHKWFIKLNGEDKILWRVLPLHAAVIYGAPESVVRELLLVYRDGAKCQDDAGLLPLHFALNVGSSVGVVTLLILAFRESVFVRDNKGMLPMDIVRRSSAAHKDGYLFSLLWALSQSRLLYFEPSLPDTILVYDSTTFFPLEIQTKLMELISLRRWPEAMTRLRDFPEECRVNSSWGDGKENFLTGIFPIHAAVLHGATEDFITDILREYPESACLQDCRKSLPLHLAVESNCEISVVSLLLAANPCAAYTKDSRGLLPIDIVQLSSSPHKIAYTRALKSLPCTQNELSGNKETNLVAVDESSYTLQYRRNETIADIDWNPNVILDKAAIYNVQDESITNLDQDKTGVDLGEGKNAINVGVNGNAIEVGKDERTISLCTDEKVIDIETEKNPFEIDTRKTAMNVYSKTLNDVSPSFDVDDYTLEDHDASNSIVNTSYETSYDSSTTSSGSNVVGGENVVVPTAKETRMFHSPLSSTFLESFTNVALYNFCSGSIQGKVLDV